MLGVQAHIRPQNGLGNYHTWTNWAYKPTWDLKVALETLTHVQETHKPQSNFKVSLETLRHAQRANEPQSNLKVTSQSHTHAQVS